MISKASINILSPAAVPRRGQNKSPPGAKEA
nr:MAG TPA: hypothetical protein [Caudoviricetes sp.]